MTVTLLIDLDDTLLGNDIETFVPAYLQALAKHLSPYVAPDVMITQLLAATQVMTQNESASLTLEDAFDQAFYPAIQRSKTELHSVINQFYDEVYPGLSYLTQPRPEAICMVKEALTLGHQVVIATNPIFPRKAIYHRLKWAGLDPDDYSFPIITSYEEFHFAKPNPAYVAEILAQLGWPDQPAVFIGNSLSGDLIPSTQIGLPGFWVAAGSAGLPPGLHPLSSSGSLADVTDWLRTIEAAGVSAADHAPLELLAKLKSTPAAIDTLCRRCVSQQWSSHAPEEEWNLASIICHMRDVDREVNIPRFQAIIAGENPFVPGINTDTWADERDYQNQDGPTALREFIQLREQMIGMLSELAPEDWQKPARHAIFGPTRLAELIEFVVTHDSSHLQSLVAALK